MITLEPGERGPVNFCYESGQPADHYEVMQPAHVVAAASAYAGAHGRVVALEHGTEQLEQADQRRRRADEI